MADHRLYAVAGQPWMSFHVQVDDLDAVIWAKRHVERDAVDKAPRGHKHAYARNLLDLQRHALAVGGRWKLVEEEVGCGRLPIRVRSRAVARRAVRRRTG